MDFFLAFSLLQENKTYLTQLINYLNNYSVKCVIKQKHIIVSSSKKTITLNFNEENNNTNSTSNQLTIPLDYIINQPEKTGSILLSKLNLNKTIFARNCKVKKLDKTTSTDFYNQWHFFNSVKSAYNYGLFYNSELIGAAAFSKGRKMNRLQTGLQSFELIRFCCKSGITVSGGLSKLMNHFCEEKKAGDVMTYIDKQFSDGSSFIKAGFVKHSEKAPLHFIINKKTFQRTLVKENEPVDKNMFYETKNSGNIKLIYTPKNKLKPLIKQ